MASTDAGGDRTSLATSRHGQDAATSHNSVDVGTSNTTDAQHIAPTAANEKEEVTPKSAVQFTSMSTADSVSISTTDEVGTLISSLDGKAPSIGGKSSASIATFAMDEKESLRPDDSASIAAATEEDEEAQGRPGEPVHSNNGSNEDVRAFRQQLNEISAIDPLRRSTAAGVDQNGVLAQGVLYVPENAQPAPGDLVEVLPDVKLLEALENPRDRIWVLKLEQDVIDFVKDAKESSLVLPQCNSFYRMLAHKIADYYLLGHSVDDSNSAVRLFKSPMCRIPQPLTGVVTPSTAASTPPPSMQMKILRRGMDISGPAIANGSNMPSKSTSETGESCDDDLRKPVTREEREARYEAARLRIMGSAKPGDGGDVQKDESRSSSVSGRKARKGRRENSDDDFEARSAYNSFFTPNAQVYQAQQFMQGAQLMPSQFPQYGPGYAQSWYPPGQESDPPAWTQQQQQQQQTTNFDLAREFDRSMSLQQTYSAPQSPYGQTSFQQGYAPYWPQGGTTSNGHSSPSMYTLNAAYGDRPSSSTSQPPSYAYGQLPSQALGRPPNALEHPLPGSYKSRHFNPQSQAFIPGHDGVLRPFLPQRTMSGPSGNGPERPMSTQSQGSHLSSLGQQQHGTIASRLPPHSLTHPLPQPVFSSHTLPAATLPPKPTQRMSLDAGRVPQQPVQQGGDTIAKWGTPASLPAKPPPLVDSPDSGKRQAQAMPSFGSMPAGGRE